ncbi:MAG: hypothetical protein HY695_20260 [Deltaproteobacteria bacterium]|nr:hypothetical protein [Deltaproteobacteria bacterium]
MKGKRPDIAAEYTAALKDYLAKREEAALTRAYEIGREALGESVGVLEIATVHHQALRRLLPKQATASEAGQLLAAAENFFVESLSPFEMSHRGAREANTALRSINETMEEQAKRIAHSLHDEAGQLLASVHIELDRWARETPDLDPERLSKIKQMLDETGEQLRRLSHELCPPILGDRGLRAALEFLAEGVSERSGIEVTVKWAVEGRLPLMVETALYRVVQQGLNNVIKHGRATWATAELQMKGSLLRCSVRDDGVGFDVATVLSKNGKRGLGLVGMGERVRSLGGTFKVLSAPGKGTELLITIPLEK